MVLTDQKQIKCFENDVTVIFSYVLLTLYFIWNDLRVHTRFVLWVMNNNDAIKNFYLVLFTRIWH